MVMGRRKVWNRWPAGTVTTYASAGGAGRSDGRKPAKLLGLPQRIRARFLRLLTDPSQPTPAYISQTRVKTRVKTTREIYSHNVLNACQPQSALTMADTARTVALHIEYAMLHRVDMLVDARLAGFPSMGLP